METVLMLSVYRGVVSIIVERCDVRGDVSCKG